MKEIKVEARSENVSLVTEFVEEQLECMDCPMKIQMKMGIAIDELFSNIALYAYPSGDGDVTVRVEKQEEPAAVRITFIDRGVPYDPLKKEDPDVTLSAEEREIGGLGIYLVKKTMDDISYGYKDGQNILSVLKLF